MPIETPKHKLAEADHRAGMSYKLIAEKYSVSINTVKSWKTRYWGKKGVHTKSKKVCTQAPTSAHSKSAPCSIDEQLAAVVEEDAKLTPQQKDFCVYFTRTRNATQAYLKAYSCAYTTANVNGPRLLVNTCVAAKLKELQHIKNAALGDLCGDDVVELHMRIAFADLTDYVEYSNVNRPILHNGKPIPVTNPKTGESIINPETGQPTYLSYSTNDIKFQPSDRVDGQLITEVSQGRDGGKIKLRNQDVSMRFLEQYFSLNPSDQHRMEYDSRKLEVELMKIQATLPPAGDETGSSESNFSDALKSIAGDGEVWDDE